MQANNRNNKVYERNETKNIYSNFRSRNPLSHNIDFGHDCLIRIGTCFSVAEKKNNVGTLNRKDMTKSRNDAITVVE